MNHRSCVVAVVAVVIIFLTIVGLGVWGLVRILSPIRSVLLGTPPPNVQVRNESARTLAVFNFTGEGDPDAEAYAIGFGRALADRLHCAPNFLTIQPTASETWCAACMLGRKEGEKISDEIALKAGRALGVRHVVTGTLKVSGGQVVVIKMRVAGPFEGSQAVTFEEKGALADLPAMQASAAGKIMKLLAVSVTPEQRKSLRAPNFSKSEVLRLYGRSHLTKDFKEAEACRWKALDLDPTSSFAAIRLLEFYFYGPATGPEISSNRKLQALMSSSDEQFGHNLHIGMTRALILEKEFDYKGAEKSLRDLVVANPDSATAHLCLTELANNRGDAGLALSEARNAVIIWPESAVCHASLAEALGAAGQSIRHGHFWRNVRMSDTQQWQGYADERLAAARTAVGIDPNSRYGLMQLLYVGVENGAQHDMEEAFTELIRLNPRDYDAYRGYALEAMPLWNNSPKKLDAIMAMMKKSFGKDSAEVSLLRADIVLNSEPPEMRGPRRPLPEKIELMKLADAVLKKEPASERALGLKWQASVVNRKRDDAYRIGKLGFEKWGTSIWYERYGEGLEFRYEDKNDWRALETARQVFARYSQELPYSPRGYTQLGWCLSHQGKRDEARKMFLKALEIDPGYQSAKDKLKYVQ